MRRQGPLLAVWLNVAVVLFTVSSCNERAPTDYESLLRDAAAEGDIHKVRDLIDRGVDVNAYGSAYGTALLFAAGNGHREIVALLLEKGANVNVKNRNDFTPLMGAASRGHNDVVELLIEKGADVMARDSFGESAYEMAIKNGHQSTAAIILAARLHRSSLRNAHPIETSWQIYSREA
jgi:uncharacterized protein